jgi:hypothetical protein
MNTKTKITVTLSTIALSIFVSISNRIQDNGTGSLEIQPTIAATTQPTITPPPQKNQEKVVCPNEGQILLTPHGQSDPICVYKMGSIGQKIRTELHEKYTRKRFILRGEGKSLQTIEQELYWIDLQIMDRIQQQLQIGEMPAHPDEI